jgi:hypothetical protein
LRQSRRERTGRVDRDDDINIERNQLSGQLGKQIKLSFCRPHVENQVLPFDIAGFAELSSRSSFWKESA